MTHYLINDKYETIYQSDTFQPDLIKKSIVEYLLAHPEDILTHEKTGTDKRCAGNDVINIYEMNKNEQPCLVITKSNKEYHKPLTF